MIIMLKNLPRVEYKYACLSTKQFHVDYLILSFFFFFFSNTDSNLVTISTLHCKTDNHKVVVCNGWKPDWCWASCTYWSSWGWVCVPHLTMPYRRCGLPILQDRWVCALCTSPCSAVSVPYPGVWLPLLEASCGMGQLHKLGSGC